MGNRQSASHARDTRARKQQVFNVAPPVYPDARARGADPKSGHEGETRSWRIMHAEVTAVDPKSNRSSPTRCDDRNDITRCTTAKGALV